MPHGRASCRRLELGGVPLVMGEQFGQEVVLLRRCIPFPAADAAPYPAGRGIGRGLPLYLHGVTV